MKTLLGYALHSSDRPRFYIYLADLLQNLLDNRHGLGTEDAHGRDTGVRMQQGNSKE